MNVGRCKWAGCRETCAGTHCEPHRVAFNEKEKRKGGRRKQDRVEGQCAKCFVSGHGENECRWQPSLLASYETPWETAQRVGQ